MHQIAVIIPTSAPALPADQTPQQWIIWAAAGVVWLIIVVVVGRVMGLFRADSIVGPERLAHDESGWLLMSNVGFGIGAGFMIPILVSPALGRFTEQQKLALLNVGVHVTGIVALLAFSKWWRGGQTAKLGLRPGKIGIGVIGGITALVIIDPLVIVAGQLVQFVFQLLHIPMQTHEMLTLMKETPTHSWVFAGTLTTACAIAPLAEELVFRGMLQTALGRGFAIWFDRGHPAESPGLLLTAAAAPVVLDYRREVPARWVPTSASARWLAVIVTSLIFAGIHDSKVFFVPLFVLSVGFGYLYERTGNLWATVVAHGLFNLTNTLVFLGS